MVNIKKKSLSVVIKSFYDEVANSVYVVFTLLYVVALTEYDN